MSLIDVLEFTKEKFQLDTESVQTANVLLLKIKGIDNYSLAKYLYEKYQGIKITVCSHERYRYSNLGWVKIELSNTNLLLDTNKKHL